jgi:predicted transcriptional regulator
LKAHSLDFRALNLAEVFRNTDLPILVIVDIHGKFVGTVREREIIRRLASVQENYFDPST